MDRRKHGYTDKRDMDIGLHACIHTGIGANLAQHVHLGMHASVYAYTNTFVVTVHRVSRATMLYCEKKEKRQWRQSRDNITSANPHLAVCTFFVVQILPNRKKLSCARP